MEKNPFQFTSEFWNFFTCIHLIKKFSIFIASSAQKWNALSHMTAQYKNKMEGIITVLFQKHMQALKVDSWELKFHAKMDRLRNTTPKPYARGTHTR